MAYIAGITRLPPPVPENDPERLRQNIEELIAELAAQEASGHRLTTTDRMVPKLRALLERPSEPVNHRTLYGWDHYTGDELTAKWFSGQVVKEGGSE
jgi:hypothetical protein